MSVLGLQVENFVQFVPKDQLPAEAVRGNTPFILPRLPADVFYPFTSSARTARKPLAWLLCLLCLSVALLGAS